MEVLFRIDQDVNLNCLNFSLAAMSLYLVPDHLKKIRGVNRSIFLLRISDDQLPVIQVLKTICDNLITRL